MGTHSTDPDSPGPDPGAEGHAARSEGSRERRFVFDGTAYVPVSSRERGRRRGLASRVRHLIRHHRRSLGTGMLVLGGLVILGALWTGWRAYQAYSHLADARATVARMDAAVQAKGLDSLGDLTDLADTFAGETAAARSAVDDPIYRLASHVPLIGENLGAVRDVAAGLDGIARSVTSGLPALEPLANHTSWAAGGRFDLAVLKPAAAAITRLDDAVQSAIASARTLDRGLLVSPVNEALNQYGAQLTKLSDMTSVGAQAARIVMPILGADGPRTYVVVFQNLAEARPTGGIFAFYATLKVDNGSLTLGPAGSSDRGFGYFSPPVADISGAYTELYGIGTTQWPQFVNNSPDFPLAAEMFSKMYETRTGQHPDGIIALDPVVVATLMKGTAPIDIGEGMTLSSESAVSVLLAQMYDVFPGGARLAERDALMKRAVSAAFGAMVGNLDKLRPRDLLSDVSDLITQRRVLVWSDHADEESGILGSAVSGRQRPDTAGSPTTGIFLIDRNGGKMSYYLRGTANLGAATCAAGGAAALPLTITLTNTAPKSGLPPYVAVGAGDPDNLQLGTNIIMTAPSAGTIGDVYVDGKKVPARLGVDQGRHVVIISVAEFSGKTSTITTEVTISPEAQGGDGTHVTPRLITTPMAFPFPATTTEFAKCHAVPSNG